MLRKGGIVSVWQHQPCGLFRARSPHVRRDHDAKGLHKHPEHHKQTSPITYKIFDNMEHQETLPSPLCECVGDEPLLVRRCYVSPAIEVLSVAVGHALLAVSRQTGGWHDPSGGGNSGHGSSDDGTNDGNNGHDPSQGEDIGDDDSPGKGWEWDIDAAINPW